MNKIKDPSPNQLEYLLNLYNKNNYNEVVNKVNKRELFRKPMVQGSTRIQDRCLNFRGR